MEKFDINMTNKEKNESCYLKLSHKILNFKHHKATRANYYNDRDCNIWTVTEE